MEKKKTDKKRNKKVDVVSKITLKALRNQRGKISLIISILLMLFSLLLIASITINYIKQPTIIFNQATLIANFFVKYISFDSSNNLLLLPSALFIFILSILILLYRCEKPYSYIKIIIFGLFFYSGYLTYMAFNEAFPKYINFGFLNSELPKSDILFSLFISFVIEICLYILLRPICDILNAKYISKKIKIIEGVKKQEDIQENIIEEKDSKIDIVEKPTINDIIEPVEEISPLGVKLPNPIDTPKLSFIDMEKPISNDIGNIEIPKGINKYKENRNIEDDIKEQSNPSVVSLKTMEYARQNYLDRQKRQGIKPEKPINSILANEVEKASNSKKESFSKSDESSLNIFTVINERIEKNDSTDVNNLLNKIDKNPQKVNPAVRDYYERDRQIAKEKVMNIFNARVHSKPESVIGYKERTTNRNQQDSRYSNNSNRESIANIMRSGNLIKATELHSKKQREKSINQTNKNEENLDELSDYIRPNYEEEIIKEDDLNNLDTKNDNSLNNLSSSLHSNSSISYGTGILEDDEIAINNYYSTAKSVGDSKLVDEEQPIVKKIDIEEDLDSGIKGLATSNLLNPNRYRYQFPSYNLLQDYPSRGASDHTIIEEKAEILLSTLAEFNYNSQLRDIKIGPSVTMFEIIPEPGIKVTKIDSLKSNIAMDLKAKKVRIIAPIPGQGAVGVEIPNDIREIVGFKELLQNVNIDKLQIPMVLGKTIYNECKVFDVTKSPHMLVAGSTGSGKSVCINSLICSILYSKSPREVRLIMIDPKKVELSLYNNIPHLLTPVIVDPKRAIKALDFCIEEMDRRNDMLAKMNVRNIISYNDKIRRERIAKEKMPYIVVIIDEFASLMSIVGKDLDERVSRLTAMSRAVGIHLVFATQRPSVDVITGVIKNNLPTRIAFAVTSVQDSRTIIGYTGAEDLLGRGDMLFSESGKAAIRMQGVFLSDGEVEDVVEFTKSQGEPDYIDESYFEDFYEEEEDSSASYSNDEDQLYDAAIKIAYENNGISGSYLQRKFSIGYNKAARIVDRMEQEGIVGPINGSKKRELLK